jgi:hypothetical protein
VPPASTMLTSPRERPSCFNASKAALSDSEPKAETRPSCRARNPRP